MEINESTVLIIGGGLTGLTLAYLLRRKGISITILEARNRLGGRIFTTKNESIAPLEMGATWFGKKHQHLIHLLKELNLEKQEQYMGDLAVYEPISTSPPQLVTLPPNPDPSFRIKGGTNQLLDALVNQLDDVQIHTEQVVQSIQQEKQLLVKTDKNIFQAAYVVSTLPPFLLAQSIDIQPTLPDSFLQVANETHTWMGESIKVGLSYAHPFWREKNTSGTIFSNVGPIPEMYDHSNADDTKYALVGFMNGAYGIATKEHRKELILKQLHKYFGGQVNDFLAYEEKIWSKESFTFSSYPTPLLPHYNNGHPVFRKAYLNGQFFIAGSETSANSPGYMEGAIQSAQFVNQQIQACL